MRAPWRRLQLWVRWDSLRSVQSASQNHGGVLTDLFLSQALYFGCSKASAPNLR